MQQVVSTYMVQPLLECLLDILCPNHTNSKNFAVKDIWGNTPRNTFSNNPSPHFVTYVATRQHNNCLHSLLCLTNINLCTNCHNKVVYALVNTLLAHPTTHCFTSINVRYVKGCTPKNAITFIAPPLLYIPWCNCHVHPHPNVLCIQCTPPTVGVH